VLDHAVDDFGRDPHLVRALSPLAALRWSVSVGGTERLPTKGGAMLVCNDRLLSYTPVWAAWALWRHTGRTVRFVGRPDIAPVGSMMRRIGGLLADPDEVAGALRHHEIVLVSCAASRHARHAGTVPHELIGAAVVTHTPVFPLATTSSVIGRSARVEVGPQVRHRHERRGPLAEVELAEQVQRHLQRMLDGLGGTQTGVAPLDWLADG
jgi:1-acyl-sn-glycerol-3-phosphate acyltransferase